jgi:hypothetical protein
MSIAVSQFITELAVHFGRKHDTPEAEDAWLKSMVLCLKGYNRETLSAAATRIINSRAERSFPLPAECKKVCDEIATWQTSQSARLPVDRLPPTFSPARVKLADDLVMCPMGQEAAKDGWILAIHDFARENGRLPTGGEISKVKAVPKGFDAAYADNLRCHGEMAKALKVLGDKMIARRKELTEMVLHGVVR